MSMSNPRQAAQEVALVTLVFPDTGSISAAPSRYTVPSNVSAELLPSSSSSFSTLAHDTSLAFSVPYTEAADFLMAMQEIAAPETAADSQGSEKEGTREDKKWLMRASKNATSPGGVRNWIQDSWTSFVDLLKVCAMLPSFLPDLAKNHHRTRIPATLSSWPWDISPCT
jgi:hydroxymethylglutaryl-CoA reductase (NADPH)